MAAQLGWSGYGDKQYPAHVLRYYPFGRAFTAEGNQAIVEIALTQVGNLGGEPYWSWWGLSERAEWCAMFVSWCADQAGLIDAGAIPKFENCVWGANWFKDNAGWAGGSARAEPGDIIFSTGSRMGVRIMWASLKNAREVWYTPLRATLMTTAPRDVTM